MECSIPKIVVFQVFSFVTDVNEMFLVCSLEIESGTFSSVVILGYQTFLEHYHYKLCWLTIKICQYNWKCMNFCRISD